MGLKCEDRITGAWYPDHEWTDGQCRRCGRWLPGMSTEDINEAQAQRQARRCGTILSTGNYVD